MDRVLVVFALISMAAVGVFAADSPTASPASTPTYDSYPPKAAASPSMSPSPSLSASANSPSDSAKAPESLSPASEGPSTELPEADVVPPTAPNSGEAPAEGPFVDGPAEGPFADGPAADYGDDASEESSGSTVALKASSLVGIATVAGLFF